MELWVNSVVIVYHYKVALCLTNPVLVSKDKLWEDPSAVRDRRASGLGELKRLGVLRQKPKDQLERRRLCEETEPVWEGS